MKHVVALMLTLAACATDDVPGSPTPAPPPTTPARPGALPGNGPQRMYSIEAVPTGLPGGSSQVSKAICSAHAVVGSATFNSINEGHAIRFDASGLTDLGTNGVNSRATDGNAAGTIVGVSAGRAVVFANGTTSALPTLGGVEAVANGINARGDIVGESQILPGGGDGPNHAVLWKSCMAIDLGSLGLDSFATDINDAGVIVGTTVDANNHAHAVSWDESATLTDLGSGGAANAQAVAIDAAGVVAGFTYQPDAAVLWDAGTLVELGTLGGTNSLALGLDDRGDVVGASTTAAEDRAHAFLYANGEMIALEQVVDNLGTWQLLEARDVCDDGMIVGNGILDGVVRGYVLMPE